MATIKNGKDVIALGKLAGDVKGWWEDRPVSAQRHEFSSASVHIHPFLKIAGAFDSNADLRCFEIGRPKAGPNDIEIDIQYCGMCHSDCHACNGDWGINSYPIAPGHEIAGVVRAVGDKVTEFKVGDKVGVGCMVQSCKQCEQCKAGLEQHCPKMTQTYGSPFQPTETESFKDAVGHHTNGGYTTAITVDEHFVFHVPSGMKMEYAGVLLCAGITVYSPLNRHILKKGGGKGKSVAIVGFGGLGQMAIKVAKAMGVDSVTVLSRSEKKRSAAERMGCEYLVHTDEDKLKESARKFDVVLDTVAAVHDVAKLVGTLKVGGTWVLLGAIAQPFEISAFALISSRHSLEGSLIGGIPETQEMLDFCAKHGIVPEYEVIHAKDADAQFHALIEGTAAADRKVIDMSTLKGFAENSS